MTLNPYVDQELILARVKQITTPVYESIDDIQVMPRFGNGTLKPVVEVSFGIQFPTARGRTFAEESAQPHESYFFVIAYGANKQTVRSIMGDLMRPEFLIGWSPSQNASGLWGGDGTEYTIRSETRPTIYAQRTTFRWVGNLASQSL